MESIVIIPVFQPEAVLERLVDELWKNDNFIIVVDDGNSGESQAVFRRLAGKAIVLHHAVNKGKGAAIKTALEYIRDNFWECDVIGVMDGDGQHLTKDMEKLIFRAGKDTDALVLGVRQIGRKMPMRSRIGNMMTRNVFWLISGIYVSDTQSGLRAFQRKRIEEFLEISGERYEYETAVLFHCAKNKIPIVEVPIDTIYKDEDNSTSHFHIVSDSIKIYHELLKFALSSMSSFCLDYLLFSLLIFLFGKFTVAVLSANICARVVSAAYNFLLNTRFVFRKKSCGKTAGKYIALVIGILLLNNVFLNGYINLLRMNVYIAKMVTEVTLFVLSFAAQKVWIFRRSDRQTAKKCINERRDI